MYTIKVQFMSSTRGAQPGVLCQTVKTPQEADVAYRQYCEKYPGLEFNVYCVAPDHRCRHGFIR